MDYQGIKCPVCEKPFTAQDDIVVCPECGAPYHRACYTEKGACIFHELHESGRAWEPPAPPVSPDISAEIKDKECPQCGVLNAHSALFCTVCGASLTGAPDHHANRRPGPAEYPRQGQPFTPPPPPPPGVYGGFPGAGFAFDPMGGTNPNEMLAENVTYGDVSKLVQQNSGYYLSVFRSIRSFGRGRFSAAGFLFSGGWLLYRKQYRAGILVSALMLLLMLGNTLFSYFFVLPMLSAAVDSLGASFESVTYMQLVDAMTLQLEKNPGQIVLFLLPMLFYLAMLGIMLFVGIRGNRMYMNHCIRTVQRIKKETPAGEQPDTELMLQGGVAIPAAVCLLVCYLIIRWLPTLLLGV